MAKSCLILHRWRESSRNRKDTNVIAKQMCEEGCIELDSTSTAIGIPVDHSHFQGAAQQFEHSCSPVPDAEPLLRDKQTSLPVIHILALTEQWYMPSSQIDLRGAEELGRGSCATVYRARLRETGSEVAVKVLSKHCSSPHAMNDLMQEVIVASSLRKHPNVVGFLGASFEDSKVQIVYELVHGCTLEQFYNEECPEIRPSTDVLVSWSKQLLLALAFLHEGSPSIIHRDVKPDNVFISSDLSSLKLGDFGLCKVLDKTIGCRDTYRMSGNTGAWRYMAPEIFCEEGDGYTAAYASSADIFSAGMVIWYMFHGEPPHIAIEPRLVAELSCKNGLRPSLEKIGQENLQLARLLERSWSARPDERPSAREMAEKLAHV